MSMAGTLNRSEPSIEPHSTFLVKAWASGHTGASFTHDPQLKATILVFSSCRRESQHEKGAEGACHPRTWLISRSNS